MSQQLQEIEKVLSSHKLSGDDYAHIKQILGREPNLVEIGIFSAMWSEHCSYKSSKVHLSGFPTKAPWVIQGPGENAGVIDIGGGYAAVFKMESHNHPSFIEPYQGAATGVGGIMRDVFTMGARPIANLNALRFGDVLKDNKTSAHQRYLVRGVVAGIGGYGNCMGVPTIGGETSFDECYNGNILVNAFTLGLAKSDEIFYGRADGIGNPVIYVGAKTGRDGLGGAVMSSDSFTEESKSLRPTVQVGDPFTEKLLLEACLELFKTDHVVGIQDMGAAGLTSSSFEMAGRSGSGMIMHLDRVPAREEGMTPYDFMLSESQERMLLCAKKGSEAEIIKIFEKWDLDAAVIGEVTATGNMELFWHGDKVAEVPVNPVSEEAPVLNRPMSRPAYLDKIASVTIDDFARVPNQEAFERLTKSMEVVDKSWIYTQYDSMVQTNTIKKGGMLDASVVRVKENGKALAMSADCNVRYCYIDPKGGAAAAVIESGRNVAMSGARPLAITDCLNFGNPENPEVMWQFGQSCLGIKEACSALTTPVIGGNVSLYNETNGVSVFPTPSIATVGVNDDQNKVLMSSFQGEGNTLYLVGESNSEFGGSLYMKEICGVVAGVLPEIDYEKELTLWDLVIEANKKGILECAKDASSGGVAIALAKMAAVSGLGCSARMLVNDERDIFAESMSRAIIEVKQENSASFESMAGVLQCQKLGTVGGDIVKINNVSMSMKELQDNYFNTFKRVIERDI
ncbi:phosphoribosylformylglycinamidine synthase subunit II [Sulfurimonas denitrificans DSM 1251]|uniref:Phosphoribosylformylglycinamidine synthase subunit PurL n=1 Tax=Sulfurimonas denitrificans (strain ATCC 33889 / DSM 1251) TaxID=326298 RepID=PURL_SULDN|nr:phosphoribosylformylglycinamidine synthase subunit PurL [Sulfurimonas denitrificans]Q30T55.1 RecName: Full=Phosphoribosylformylglycinamidine synthase subunit PurL; Short=FGAM synthase; AltName: Full=Formylglycinamide ribonucleotide amidotransferase subunit II; Short=FGAR amidotransferase II; Short=FGAR-AT II; AltName: Full=Glutamine amidotransferase PurL; AltName: Full=Phosphoribosylformylglycinamidine synthase subunit II [Sulfurimonas denitrificans DSM 1251]ABB43826.1 phosphoribosylformylglyc